MGLGDMNMVDVPTRYHVLRQKRLDRKGVAFRNVFLVKNQ